MEVKELNLERVLLIVPRRLEDERGFFSEVYRYDILKKYGFDRTFVQENHSCSAFSGVVRGLHFQIPPHAQDKLVRVVRGRIMDVVVDIRVGSPTFGQHVAIELSAANWRQLFVPAGFAHGFCTLEPDTEVIYKVSEYYAPAYDKGLAWDDPALNINWPVSPAQAILSEKDRKHPRLAELPAYFHYGER